MVGIFGFRARHGRAMAIELGDHALDDPAGDMDADRASARGRCGLW